MSVIKLEKGEVGGCLPFVMEYVLGIAANHRRLSALFRSREGVVCVPGTGQVLEASLSHEHAAVAFPKKSFHGKMTHASPFVHATELKISCWNRVRSSLSLVFFFRFSLE
jgi:hypothetical protein